MKSKMIPLIFFLSTLWASAQSVEVRPTPTPTPTPARVIKISPAEIAARLWEESEARKPWKEPTVLPGNRNR